MMIPDAQKSQLRRLRESVEEELLGNILPFWYRLESEAGFHGGLSNDIQPVRGSPLALVMMARLLWTYSRAYRTTGHGGHLAYAGRIYTFIMEHFSDTGPGGYVWWLGPDGNVLEGKKQTYGQAFALYGLSEYFMASGEARALEQARELFSLMEKHCWNNPCGGYWEANDRNWRPMQDVRLSEKDMNAPFSMNTHLHVMEGYANLLLAAPGREVAAAARKVLNVVTKRILRPDEPRFGLFYDSSWGLLSGHISPGHDIEGSWLIWETAGILDDRDLQDELRPLVLGMADCVLRDGMDSDGGVRNEYEPGKGKSADKDWWPQAEGVVGFLNAFQMTGNEAYLAACRDIWEYIREYIVDPVHGEWFAGRQVNGDPLAIEKAGPWKSAYHNGRMGFEVIKRVNEILGE